MGKLTTKELQELLACIRPHQKVVIPPSPGYDSGVHKIGEDEYLVISTDPCIDVPEDWFGWLLVHYAASDVALFGARPEFCTINLLGSTSTEAAVFQRIMRQSCNAADELMMTIVTGHTGTYDGVASLVGVCTAYGLVKRDLLITPGGAKPGDHIICTKLIGLETAANFAIHRRAVAESLFGEDSAEALRNSMDLQTCVTEALLLAEGRLTRAMHDATEGGLVAALSEMANSSNVGFRLDVEKVPVLREMRLLGRSFGLSQNELLSTSSTGTLLAAVEEAKKDVALGELKKHNIEAASIGVFTENTKRVIRNSRGESLFPKRPDDPYARMLFSK